MMFLISGGIVDFGEKELCKQTNPESHTSKNNPLLFFAHKGQLICQCESNSACEKSCLACFEYKIMMRVFF